MTPRSGPCQPVQVLRARRRLPSATILRVSTRRRLRNDEPGGEPGAVGGSPPDEDAGEPPGRAALREHLRALGVPDDAIERAAAANRLVLLPAESVLGEPSRYTLEDLAERVGLDVGMVAGFAAALGLPVPPAGAMVAGEDDLAATRALAAFLAAGLPAGPLLEVVRVGGQGSAALSRAMVGLLGRTLLQPGDTELDLALRLERVARDLLPHAGTLQGYALRRHLLETVRRQMLSAAEVTSGTAATTVMSVAFADLSGFTRLGARVDAEETGRVASRLAELAAAAVTGTGVQLVKLVGDAAMLAGRDAGELLEVLLSLGDAVEAEGDDYPALHSGAAHGPTVARGGDWFGHTVTLASRLSGIARPGTVVVDAGLAAAVEQDSRFALSHLRLHHVRGVTDRVDMYRARRAQE